jgi:hypothetical protein
MGCAWWRGFQCKSLGGFEESVMNFGCGLMEIEDCYRPKEAFDQRSEIRDQRSRFCLLRNAR